MEIIKAKIEYSKNGPDDEYYTPDIAVEMIVPFIPRNVQTVWESTAIGESRIVEVSQVHDFKVIPTHISQGYNFFTYEPDDYDIIITNPPYSLKDEFLKRAFELEKPFMFLLPITSLEGVKRGWLFRKYGIQLIVPDCRYKFKPDGSGAWFQTSWFTHGLNLKKDLIFISVRDFQQ